MAAHALKKRPNRPFYATCAYRAECTERFPECACASCTAPYRRNCAYITARNAQKVVYHGPDFRPKCLMGLPVRCGVVDTDYHCEACLGGAPRMEPEHLAAILNAPATAEGVNP